MNTGIQITKSVYQNALKPALFLLDPELVHLSAFEVGEFLGSTNLTRNFLTSIYKEEFKNLSQRLNNIDFSLPVGLAAGFDYQAQLTQVLPCLGFGFTTIGTITNLFCQGNKKPRLKRLPNSRALLVNKGFKNPGADEIVESLNGQSFKIPVGISIGRTNVEYEMSFEDSVADIVCCFSKFEKAQVNNSFYELNISCPNLYGQISFYPQENLKKLLSSVDRLNISKPIYIKMPIEKTDEETYEILDLISGFSPAGVIFGNLQKDRKASSINNAEIAACGKGNISGKPTFNRSNELISLTYKSFRDRFTIIGCGGIFSAEDAFEKISRGASLVQLITGMIYQGPQLIAEINSGLDVILQNKGYSSIREAVGCKN